MDQSRSKKIQKGVFEFSGVKYLCCCVVANSDALLERRYFCGLSNSVLLKAVRRVWCVGYGVRLDQIGLYNLYIMFGAESGRDYSNFPPNVISFQ